MEESVSGFELRGDWADIVEHGERITLALYDLGAHEDSPELFEEWVEWRPKVHEHIDEDLNKKTAKQARTEAGEGEKAGKAPNEDICIAGERLVGSYEKLDEDVDEAVDEWRRSIRYVARAADSAGRKALRAVEDTVYKRIMTQIAPYYFDNELISANLQRDGRSNERFVFEVNINDDGLKSDVAELLYEYDDTVVRWHVTTPKKTRSVEVVEGVDPPTTEGDDRPRPTRN